MEKYDAIIIGFGKGGKTLAANLSAIGRKVALIEKSNKMYGGTCINIGCIPSKSLVNSSKASVIKAPANYDEKNEIYKEAIDAKRSLTSMLRKKNFDKLNDMDNVDVFNGFGSFVSNKIIKIDSSDKSFEIEGVQVFINTGSTPIMPAIKGLEGNPYVFDTERLMDIDVLPKRLAIIGAGYAGLEFASIYRAFGSEVTVYQIEDKFLPKEDRDIAEAILITLKNKGIKFHTKVTIEEIKNNHKEASVEYREAELKKSDKADAVLIATGRKPNIEGLNPEKAGVEITDRGAIKVDDKLKTTSNNIWAMGDAAGSPQFTYISLDDFRIVFDQIAGKGARSTKDRRAPYSLFIDPPYARIGLNEEEAADKNIEVKIAKIPASSIPKAHVLKNPEGVLKAVTENKTGKILGVMLFCEDAHEIINIVKLAMDAELHYTVLKDMIFTHPTMAEALNDLFAI